MNTAVYAPQTANLLAQIHQLLPRLSGRLNDTAAGTFRLGCRNNINDIKQLYEHLQQQHPEGGKIFWSCRTWALLIWQPIYLTVLSVQLLGKAVSLNRFGIITDRSGVAAYSLSPRAVYTGKPSHLVLFAGRQIKATGDHIYTCLREITPFNMKLAAKLQTDCLVSALLFQNTHYTQNSKNELDRLIAEWLAAAGLPDCQATFYLNQTRRTFGFNRQACCQEFRLTSGSLCDACPRLPLSERVYRMTQTESPLHAES
ncbi:siderophore ferric iron reductase [Neisseria leonii]|uniref:Siderophore ferric iron reductase n=1 Tax=Neisseria leonii TaxID=2995413 RepID=A0A9X4IA91_9NEIS|nr:MULTISPECIES: siderophore ferric iron reductase [unclassified Neisseria]MDD9325284.1 siderophore ferric iron reductase [Neisseria sp. 3986]MDD9327160.1 siderophore ferric iron reductase [Neisseria sp. 51.81]